MKYLMKLESFTETYEKKSSLLPGTFRIKMYWVLPTDDRYYDSLKKINLREELIPTFLKHNKDEYIYISYDSEDNAPWSWMPLYTQKMYGYEFYESKNYTFLGYINMLPEEIEKFELQKTTDKYNL